MSALDYEEIRNLLARFSQTLDLGDVEGFVGCFAPEGVLDTSFPEEELEGSHRGHDEIRKFASSASEYTLARVRQSSVNLLIEGDGNSAKVSSYAMVTRDYGPPIVAHQVTYSRLVTTGMFFDELVKLDGRWVFALRVFRHDGLPDVMDRVGKPLVIGAVRAAT